MSVSFMGSLIVLGRRSDPIRNVRPRVSTMRCGRDPRHASLLIFLNLNRAVWFRCSTCLTPAHSLVVSCLKGHRARDVLRAATPSPPPRRPELLASRHARGCTIMHGYGVRGRYRRSVLAIIAVVSVAVGSVSALPLTVSRPVAHVEGERSCLDRFSLGPRCRGRLVLAARPSSMAMGHWQAPTVTCARSSGNLVRNSHG